MGSKICCVIFGWLLNMFSQNLVIASMFFIGKLTYRSFMFRVIILSWLLTEILCRSYATSLEFLWQIYMVIVLVH